MEKETKYFRDDTNNRVRQVKILPADYPFRTLHSIARLQFRSLAEMKCIIFGPQEKLIITPEYIKSVQALPYEKALDHILSAAVAMRRASSIHIIYKASENS